MKQSRIVVLVLILCHLLEVNNAWVAREKTGKELLFKFKLLIHRYLFKRVTPCKHYHRINGGHRASGMSMLTSFSEEVMHACIEYLPLMPIDIYKILQIMLFSGL
jgi:hypothetical protein